MRGHDRRALGIGRAHQVGVVEQPFVEGFRRRRRPGGIGRIAAGQPHRQPDRAVELAGVEMSDVEVPGEGARDRPLAAGGRAVDGDQGTLLRHSSRR